MAGYDAEVIERNKKAFKEEQERIVREMSMRAHPAGSALKKEVKPKPICATCGQRIDIVNHDLLCPTRGNFIQ